MDFKKLAEEYKNAIPQNLSEEAFLKAIYIRIGKQKSFSEKYLFGNEETKRKMYMLAMRYSEPENINGLQKEVICYSLSYEIKHLLNALGYRCFVPTPIEVGEHVFPIVTLKDGRMIKYDLQRDLVNIQSGCKTQFFATYNEREDLGYAFATINDDEQTKIDKEIGYIQTEQDYKNNVMEEISKTLQEKNDLSLWQKVKRVLTDSRLNDMTNSIEYREASHYYLKNLLPHFFEKEMSRKIFFIACARKDEDNNKNVTNCVFVHDKKSPNAVFMFSKAHNRYIVAPYENLIKWQEEGLEIGCLPPFKGAKLLIRDIENYKRKSSNLEL